MARRTAIWVVLFFLTVSKSSFLDKNSKDSKQDKNHRYNDNSQPVSTVVIIFYITGGHGCILNIGDIVVLNEVALGDIEDILLDFVNCAAIRNAEAQF